MGVVFIIATSQNGTKAGAMAGCAVSWQFIGAQKASPKSRCSGGSAWQLTTGVVLPGCLDAVERFVATAYAVDGFVIRIFLSYINPNSWEANCAASCDQYQ